MIQYRSMVLSCVLLFVAGPVRAEEKRWPAEYYRAHYLATVENNPTAALAIYEKLADDNSLSDEQRTAVRSRAADARERIAASDLAKLCPADAIAFIQINQPGGLLERLTSMM